MCGQQCRQGAFFPARTVALRKRLQLPRVKAALLGASHLAEVPQQVQAVTEPAVAAASKVTGNSRRLLLGEVVGAAVAAIEKRVEEAAKSAAVKESAGVKKGTAGIEREGNCWG